MARPRPADLRSWQVRLLRACIPRREQCEVLGDLEEAYWSQVERHGLVRARLWYWRQSSRFVGRVLAGVVVAPLKVLTLAATAIPARRAVSMDPVTSLRADG